MRWRALNRVAAALFLLAIANGGLAAAQQPTSLAPAVAIEEEDAELLKTLYEHWNKQPKRLKVSGVVVSSLGAPMPKAKLTISTDLALRLEGVADEKGRFQFDWPGLLAPPILVESEDGLFGALSIPFEGGAEGNASVRITVVPIEEFKVNVRDGAGAAVSGANCGAFINNVLVARGRSDAAGTLTFRAPKPPMVEGTFRPCGVYAVSRVHGLGIAAALPIDGKAVFPSEVRLISPKPLKAKVVDRKNKPIAGIHAFVSGYTIVVEPTAPPRGARTLLNQSVPLSHDARIFVKTDVSGEATFDWYAPPPSPEPGSTVFGRRGEQYALRVGAVHPEWDRATAAFDANGSSAIVVCKVLSPSKIRGRILLPSGEPARGVQIRSQLQADPVKGMIAASNEKGEFEFTAQPGDRDVVIFDAKWIADPIPVQSLVQKSADNQIDIRLREGKQVKFRITSGPEYKPLAKHSFDLSGRNFSLKLITDDEGRAIATLDRGLYRINLNSTFEVRRARLREFSLLLKDQTSIDVPFHLDIPQSRTVEVAVFKSDGVTPAAKAQVEILNPYTETAFADRMGGPGGATTGRPPDGLERGVGGGFAGGRGGFAPGGSGGFGGGGRGGGDLPPGVDGLPARRVTLNAVATDAAGKTKVLVALDAPAILLVNGEDNERALVSVDVLEDACTIRLAKAASAKGKLIDETTGEPITGKEVIAEIDITRLSPDSRLAPSTITVVSGTSKVRSIAVTDSAGIFEFKDLIADAPYAFQLSNTRRAGAAGFGEARVLLAQLSVRNFQTSKEGVTEMGEIKAKVFAAPMPRPRIPNDPNIQ